MLDRTIRHGTINITHTKKGFVTNTSSVSGITIYCNPRGY